jgi:hypothetical protein
MCQGHRDLLLFSNIAYMSPAVVALYKGFVSKTLNVPSAIEIAAFSTFVTFITSWNFHECRSNLASIEGDAEEQSGSINAEYTPCPDTGRMWLKMCYGETRNIDNIFAIFTMLLIILHIVPLRDSVRSIYRTFGFLYIVFVILSVGPNDGSVIAGLPVMIALLAFVLPYLWVTRKRRDKESHIRRLTWSLSACFSIVAFVMFAMNEKFWLYHSLWHIFGGLSGALLVAGASSGYTNRLNDVEGNRILKSFLKECPKNSKSEK